MRGRRTVVLAALLIGLALLAGPDVESHHRPWHTKGPKPTPTSTVTPSPGPTTGPTPSPSPSPSPTITPTPSPIITPSPTPSPTATAQSAGFVRVAGTDLTLDGAPYRAVGTNLYNLASGWRTLWQCSYNAQQDLDRQLDEMGGNVELVRFWAFQRFATFNGQRNWEAFDRIVAAAKARGIRLMPTLTDHWGACETTGGTKDDSWYVTGYKELRGELASYRSYVAEFVTRYRDEPTIAIVQLVNEAESKDLGSGGCASWTVLRDFAADMAGVVKAIDTNHPLSLGTIGGGQCGTQGADYKSVHAVAGIDLCEYHDYSDNAPIPGDQWNGMQLRIDQCNELGKPLFVGELGRAMADLQARAAIFDSKLEAWFAAGVDAGLVWNAHDSLHPDCSGCFGINMPGDPVWPMLGGY